MCFYHGLFGETVKYGVMPSVEKLNKIGISAIHLLKSFINIGNKDFEQIKWQGIIHAVFLFSTLILAFTEKVLHSSKVDH